MSDIITIGSATIDVFVKCDDANIVSVSKVDSKSEFMSYPYGAKIDITKFDSTVGGGGVNTAMNFANLGFSTGAIFKIGNDFYAQGILNAFKNKNIDLSSIIRDEESSTGFSIILVSFQGDRTVLAHRGVNAEIKVSEINFDAIKKAKFIYIAPLNGKSGKVLEPIVKFAKENDIKMCFNAGTTSIKRGFEYIQKILQDAHIVVMNKEEAEMCTGVQVRSDTVESHFSKEIIHPDIKKMLKKLKIKEYQVVVITDGGNGAYAYTDETFFYCPVFPGPVESSLGAGDAFASTFCATLAEKNLDIGTALTYASVNSGSVVSKFGATEGLLTFDEIKKKLNENPDFTYTIIKED